MKKNYSVSNLTVDSEDSNKNYIIQTTGVETSGFKIPESVDNVFKIFADGEINTICNDATMEAINDARNGVQTNMIPIQLTI